MRSNNIFRIYVLLSCLFVSIFLLIFTNQAIGDTYCVANETDLIAALNNARNNGQDDVIKIQQGPYYGNFVYASTESFGLTVEGGYSDPLCTVRIVDPINTVLDGEQNGAVLVLSAPDVAANFTVSGLTLRNGSSTNHGGAGLYLRAMGGSFDISNCTITNNYGNHHSDGGGGFWILMPGNVTLSHNDISHNNSIGGGGGGVVHAPQGTLTLNYNNISNNTGVTGGGIYVASPPIATITNNIISNNDAVYYGGGMFFSPGTQTINFFNNVVNNNKDAAGAGGGGGVVFSGDSVISNNIFYNNSTAEYGGGLYSIDGNITLVNNTLINNSANNGGGGIGIKLYDGEVANIYNNIIWNNSSAEGADLYLNNDVNNDYLPSTMYLFNNDFDQSEDGTYIQIPFPLDPSNLNNLDPSFVDPDNDDYHLNQGSVLIDAGNNAAPELPTTDKDGNPRIVGSAVDIGAYEYQGFVQPVAAFKAEPVLGIAFLAVQFTDQSQGSVETWEWNFGDGSPVSNERNPSHTYNDPGIYTVILTVSGDSESDTEEKINYITVISPGAPDLVGKIKDFHSMKFGKNISLSLEVQNLGAEDACDFKVELYQSADGYTLGTLVDERFVNRCVPGGSSMNIGLKYFSDNELSGSYVIYVIDSQNHILETDETNNRMAIMIP